MEDFLILGNSRTKSSVILREVLFRKGDTIREADRQKMFRQAENSIFNTGLFLSVSIRADDTRSSLQTVIIIVKERWYTYPIPILELADRNFNEWWEIRDRDLSRLNYGLFLIQRNVRGMNETLKLKLQAGFVRKFELFYLIPYINRNKNSGLQLAFSYIRSRSTAYSLDDHVLTYLEAEGDALRRFSAGASFTRRRGIFDTHFAGFSWNYNIAADTVTAANPTFLGSRTQSYPALFYRYESDHRDIAYYPLTGRYWFAAITLTGLEFLGNPDIYSLNAGISWFSQLGRNFFLANSLSGKASLPSDQPFFNARALGYENELVRGYELYVINGQQYFLTKNSLKYRIINRTKDIKGLKTGKFNTIPLAIFVSLNTDAGFVEDAAGFRGNQRLSGTMLLGGGPGIELATYYDLVLRLEYSMNIHGDQGLFLHFGAAISGKTRFY